MLVNRLRDSPPAGRDGESRYPRRGSALEHLPDLRRAQPRGRAFLRRWRSRVLLVARWAATAGPLDAMTVRQHQAGTQPLPGSPSHFQCGHNGRLRSCGSNDRRHRWRGNSPGIRKPGRLEPGYASLLVSAFYRAFLALTGPRSTGTIGASSSWFRSAWEWLRRPPEITEGHYVDCPLLKRPIPDGYCLDINLQSAVCESCPNLPLRSRG